MGEPTKFAELSGATQAVVVVIGTSAIAILVYFLVTVSTAAIWVLRSVTTRWKKEKRQNKVIREHPTEKKADPDEESDKPEHGRPKKSLKALVKEQKAAKGKKQSTAADPAQKHPLFLHTLREHKDSVTGLAWSPDGDALCTACEDRVLRVYSTKKGIEAGMHMQQIRMITTPLDVAFGKDASEIAVVSKGLLDRASLSFYAPEEGENGNKTVEKWKIDEIFKNEPALCIKGAVLSSGSRILIACCSAKKEAKLYSSKGEMLAVMEPNSFVNHDAAFSLDGRFFSVASFTSDAKVWELQFARDSSTFKGAPKVMNLRGHKSQIMSVAFSQDSRKAITSSKDGTLKIWNIDVRYQLNEDPKCLVTTAEEVPEAECYSRLAFGPGDVVAAVWSSNIHFIDISSGKATIIIEGAHEGPIACMAWAPKPIRTKSGVSAVLATCGEDRRVRLWKAPE